MFLPLVVGTGSGETLPYSENSGVEYLSGTILLFILFCTMIQACLLARIKHYTSFSAHCTHEKRQQHFYSTFAYSLSCLHATCLLTCCLLCPSPCTTFHYIFESMPLPAGVKTVFVAVGVMVEGSGRLTRCDFLSLPPCLSGRTALLVLLPNSVKPHLPRLSCRVELSCAAGTVHRLASSCACVSACWVDRWDLYCCASPLPATMCDLFVFCSYSRFTSILSLYACLHSMHN